MLNVVVCGFNRKKAIKRKHEQVEEEVLAEENEYWGFVIMHRSQPLSFGNNNIFYYFVNISSSFFSFAGNDICCYL